MLKFAIAAAGVAFISLAGAASPGQSPTSGPVSEPVVCKYVVSAEPGAKPFQMCLTKGQWAAKEQTDAKDPNRVVCRYEESLGTRVRAAKVCMTPAQWAERERLERQEIERIQRGACVQFAGC